MGYPFSAAGRCPGAIEADAPKLLWQMDFKGHVALDGRTDGKGERCFPLTVLDDHSRYLLGAEACTGETEGTVRERLIRVFQRYGLPDAMLTDNGNPWGQQNGPTRLSVWLIRLGIRPLWSRPDTRRPWARSNACTAP